MGYIFKSLIILESEFHGGSTRYQKVLHGVGSVHKSESSDTKIGDTNGAMKSLE